jgi:peptidoglycan/xylan/chitin deacetylase (PgdA/CDA1 family)
MLQRAILKYMLICPRSIMKARALAAAVAILVSLPLVAQKRDFDPRQPSATILCYHIVQSPQDERMEISRETFRQHLQYLQMTGYNVIPLRHLYEYVAGKRADLPKNAVVITIDDGWRSAYTEAFPELQQRGFPFTLFIYPKIIGMTPLALSWEQIREMAEAGADIQSHTLSHGFLSRTKYSMDEAAYTAWLQRELAESKRIIEKQTGQKVRFLAYPYGDFDQRVVRATAKAGYDAALTCEFGRVVRGSDPLRMKRVVIDKKMDFAAFRFYMGARQLQVADTTAISARIPNFKALDPESVGMAVLSLSEVRPYAYDATTGAISLAVEEVDELTGKEHRALVWGIDSKTGRRVEASWTFKLAEPEPDPAVAAETTAARSLGATGGR